MISQSKAKDPEIKEEIVSGFVTGGNSSQDETLIKDSELTEFKNILLELDGISPRPGTSDYSTDAGTTIQGGIGYYNSNGTRELICMVDGKLKKYSSGTWTQIGSTAYSTTADCNFVQARDLLFTFNGVDKLSTYNGTTITTYTTLTTPAKPTVVPQGTTGSTAYSYRVSALNESGETLASTATAISNGTYSLSVSNYNKITWSAVSGATSYNVYGRKAAGLGETFMINVSNGSLEYRDQGQDSPSLTTLPPEVNGTGGIICSMGIFAMSRVFAAGDPVNPSRMYWSGVGTEIDNFSYSTYGGGYVDVFRNDGAQIRSIIPFQGGVIIFKDNAIYKFSFTTVVIADTQVSVPQLEEITRSFGGISFRGTKAVENDVVFPAKKDGRLAFYSLGNQENYAGSVLRTNELSIKVAEKLTDVNTAQLPQSASFYFNSIYLCSCAQSGETKNTRTWVLDTRFGAWVYWEDFNPKFYMTYEDSNGTVTPMFADENRPYLVELYKDARNDNGTAIDVQFATKAFNQKVFHKYKQYYNPTFQFKDVNQSGAIDGEIYVDGAILQGEFAVNQQVSGGSGVGTMLVGFHLPGEVPGGVVSTQGISTDIITEASYIGNGRSIKYLFRSNTTNLYYKFLSLSHGFEMLPEMPLRQSTRSYLNS